jgi:hypothetical protein
MKDCVRDMGGKKQSKNTQKPHGYSPIHYYCFRYWEYLSMRRNMDLDEI